jgi:hypothetical protein
MKYKNIIKLQLPEIQLLAVLSTQLKFSIFKNHDKPTVLLSETLFCMWECFNMGTELPTKVMLGQMLVLMQMTFLNNVRKEGRLVLSRTSCCVFFSFKNEPISRSCLMAAALVKYNILSYIITSVTCSVTHYTCTVINSMLLCVWGPQIAKLRMLIHWLVLSESEF